MAYTPNLIPVLTTNSSSLGVASGSTESSSSYYAYKAFDQNTSTYWQTTIAGVTPCWLKYCFGSITLAKAVTQYTLTASPTANTSPNTWKFQGSNDDSTWVDLDSQTGITFTAGEKKTYNFTNTTTYLFYRVYVTVNNGGTTTQIAEMEMMATIVPSNIIVSDLSLDVEFTINDVMVSGVSLEAEIGIPDILVSQVSLQVEIDIPTTLEISQHVPKIEILEYIGTGEVDTVPDISTIVLVADHGLLPGDFFVDKTARDASGMYGAERGSRRIVTTPTTKEIGYNSDIASAAPGDEILLYRFTDVTQYLMRATLSISKKANNANTADFRFILPIVSDSLYYQPKPGQYVRIIIDNELRFLGIISDTSLVGINDGNDYVFQDINCIGLKGIPARRTVTINYASTKKAGEIVAELNDTILVQEGFVAYDTTYIADGFELSETWKNDCITIADIFDELAGRNGFQWFVDDDMRLHFYQDPTTFEDAPYNLTQGGTLKYRGLNLNFSLDNYVNKNFVIGGKDINGDQIKTSNINLEQQNATQLICGGSGVYGNIIRDSSIANVLYRTAEAGTAFFTINLTAHGLNVGDYVYNETLDYVFWVATVISSDSFTVNQTIYDQTAGDSIVTYPSADAASQSILRKQGFMPKTVEYTIDHIFMEPQMKQIITLPRYGIPEGTYNIESVVMKERGVGLFESRIVAILRDADNFTTQAYPSYTDYYRGL